MILDLNRFVTEEEPVWTELETLLNRLDNDPAIKLSVPDIERFHYLYQRASSDLARLSGYSARQDVKLYLESIVGRAFSKIHETRRSRREFSILKWLVVSFPETFRKHVFMFWLALGMLLLGSVFGAAAICLDSEAKPSLMPFAHLMQDPAERVAREERSDKDEMAGQKSTFASYLISNNTRVAFFSFSLGISFGVGTMILLFSNGVFLGATVADYILAGQTKFLMAWLLPHGSIELPAIVLASQAGFVLAQAIIGWGRPVPMRTRIRAVTKDMLTLIGGVCLMLLWAGFIESFLSQYHEPAVSYHLKITFGAVQFFLLVFYLSVSGRGSRSIIAKGTA